MGLAPLQLLAAASHGVAVQASDLCHQRNAAMPVLEGEKASEQAPRAFVGASNKVVNSPMLPSENASGMLLASGAGASMEEMLRALCCHGI